MRTLKFSVSLRSPAEPSKNIVLTLRFSSAPIPSNDTSLAVIELVNMVCKYFEGRIDNKAVLPIAIAVHSLLRNVIHQADTVRFAIAVHSLLRNVIHQADTVRLSTLAQNPAYAR